MALELLGATGVPTVAFPSNPPSLSFPTTLVSTSCADSLASPSPSASSDRSLPRRRPTRGPGSGRLRSTGTTAVSLAHSALPAALSSLTEAPGHLVDALVLTRRSRSPRDERYVFGWFWLSELTTMGWGARDLAGVGTLRRSRGLHLHRVAPRATDLRDPDADLFRPSLTPQPTETTRRRAPRLLPRRRSRCSVSSIAVPSTSQAPRRC